MGRGESSGGKVVNLFEVIRRPLVTEKNTALQSTGKYGFEVDSDAAKNR
jgi:ribosomal protein L23